MPPTILTRLFFHHLFMLHPVIIEDAHSRSPVSLPDPIQSLRGGIGLVVVFPFGGKWSIHAGIQAATPPSPEDGQSHSQLCC